MKSTLIPKILLSILLAGASARSVLAETISLKLDPEQSAITLSGTVSISGNTVPLQEQGVNSLTANFDGTIPVEVSGGGIRFLGGAAIRALEPKDWQPGPGGAAGSAKASYAAKATATIIIFTVNAVAASRNVVLDATSDLIPLTGSDFPGGAIGFKFVDTANTTIDYKATGALSAQGSEIISGLLTNNVALAGTFAGPAGNETLTIPVDATFGFKTETDSGITVEFLLTFKGKLVAKRGVVAEEPAVAFVPPATGGGSITLTWPTSYKLQRTTSLEPVNWTDFAETSPVTIPPIQPGEYFRVVKK